MPDLFDPDLPKEPHRARRRDPDTSHAAAHAIVHKVSRLQFDILKILDRRRGGGATAWEMSAALNTRVGSITPRMVTLEAAGYVERTKERRQAAIEQTRPGIVWKITPAGMLLVVRCEVPQ